MEFILQLVEQQLHPATLHADRYGSRVQSFPMPMLEGMPLPSTTADVGSAAVASGLAHLLPSLAKRCPGLLDPGCTLEAAARHCDLAGLHAAWELLGEPLRSSLESEDAICPPGIWDEMSIDALDKRGPGNEWLYSLLRDCAEHALLRSYRRLEHVHGVWRRMAAAAAGSPTPDYQAKVEWVLHVSSGARRPAMGDAVWGAAAATGDAARLRWLYERGFRVDSRAAVHAVVQHASLDFLQQLEECGHLDVNYGACYHAHTAATGAAAATSDSAAKLQWLAEKGIKIGTYGAAMAAAEHFNLEALQLLKGHPSASQHAFTSGDALAAAVIYGHVPAASWLVQVGFPLEYKYRRVCLREVVRQGDLPMFRWLLGNGCHRRGLPQEQVARWWPGNTAADRRRMAEALQLVAA